MRGVGASDLLRGVDERVLRLLVRAGARPGGGRTHARLLIGAALVSGTAVLVAALWTVGQPGGEPPTGAVVTVGVANGESIPDYIAASRGELARLVAAPPTALPGGETYALVSLTGYRAPDQLTPILGGVPVEAVYVRVPLPGAQTTTERIAANRIPEDVVAGMRHIAGEKDRTAAGYRELAAGLTGGGTGERELRSAYDSGARVAQAEATAYRTGCGCVYAAVVRATPAALERMAKRPGVRAVDPAPRVRRLDRAVFVPLLPEQTDVVRLPGQTGPAGPPGIATPDPAGAPSPAPSGHPATPSPEPAASITPTAPASTAGGPPVAPPATRHPETGRPTPPLTSGPTSRSTTGAVTDAGSGR